MQIIYARGAVPGAGRRPVKNPRHFIKPVEGATKVYLDGDWPAIKEAYEAAGVPVQPISEMSVPRKRDPEPAEPKPAE